MDDGIELVELPGEIYENMARISANADTLKRIEAERPVPEKEYKTEYREAYPILNQREKDIYRRLGTFFFKGAGETIQRIKREERFKEQMSYAGHRMLPYWDMIRKPIQDSVKSSAFATMVSLGAGFSFLYFSYRTLYHLLPDYFQGLVDKAANLWTRYAYEPAANFIKHNYERVKAFIEGNGGDMENFRKMLLELYGKVKGVAVKGVDKVEEIFEKAFWNTWSRQELHLPETELREHQTLVQAQQSAAIAREKINEALLVRKGSEEYAMKKDMEQSQKFIDTLALNSTFLIDNQVEDLMQTAGEPIKIKRGKDINTVTWKGEVVDVSQKGAALRLTEDMLNTVYESIKKSANMQVFMEDETLRVNGRLDRDLFLARISRLLHGDYSEANERLKKQYEAALGNGGDWDMSYDLGDRWLALKNLLYARKSLREYGDFQNEYYRDYAENTARETGSSYRATTKWLLSKMQGEGRDTTLPLEIISLKGTVERFFRDTNTNRANAFVAWFFDCVLAGMVGESREFLRESNVFLKSEPTTRGASTVYYFDDGVPVVNTINIQMDGKFLSSLREAAMSVLGEQKEEIERHRKVNGLLAETLSVLKGETGNEAVAASPESARRQVESVVQNLLLAVPFMPKETNQRVVPNMEAVALAPATDMEATRSLT